VAPAAAPPAPGNRLPTFTYDISDLIQRPGGPTGLDGAEEVVRVIVTSVTPNTWGPRHKNPSTIQEVNGTKLEVAATPEQHDQIVDLLAALRRLTDVNVDVNCDLYEVDRNVFDRDLGRRLGERLALPLSQALAERVRKQGTRLRVGRARLANGKGGKVFSLRKAFTYLGPPTGIPGRMQEEKVGFTGLSVEAAVLVSADRRFVDVKLTQRTTDLLKIDRRTARLPLSGRRLPYEAPDLAEAKHSAKVHVGDGVSILVAVRARSHPTAAGKVLVLLVNPLVFINEEHKARGEVK
jgi:hypothetical protein